MLYNVIVRAVLTKVIQLEAASPKEAALLAPQILRNIVPSHEICYPEVIDMQNGYRPFDMIPVEEWKV